MFFLILIILLFFCLFFAFASLLGVITEKRKISLQLRRVNDLVLSEEGNAREGPPGEQEENDEAGVNYSRQKKAAFYEKYLQKTTKKLDKARLLLRPQEFLLISGGCALFSMFLLILIFRGAVLSGNPAVLLLIILTGCGIGYFLPQFYLSGREKRFKHLLNSQLSDMLLLLSNYLRAGHSVTRGIEMVSREVSSPLADELKKVIKDINLGGSFHDSLSSMEKRTGDEDLGMVVTAILIHHQVGGNLSEVLDKINHTIRERVRLKGEIRTLTAQGRLTGIIIGLLPVGVGLLVFTMSPEFVGTLFIEPLGRLMLLFAVMGELVGALLIKRIVEIEV